MERRGPPQLILAGVVFLCGLLLLVVGPKVAAAESDLPLCDGPLTATTGEPSVLYNFDLVAQLFRVVDEADLTSFSLLLSASNETEPLATTAEVWFNAGQAPGTPLANSSFQVVGPGTNTSSGVDALLFPFNTTIPDTPVRLAANTSYWLVLTLPSPVLLGVTNDVQVPDPEWPLTLGQLKYVIGAGGWTLSASRTAVMTLEGCHAVRPDPSPSPSPSQSPTPSVSLSPTPTPSLSPSPTPTPSASLSPTPSVTPTPSSTPSTSPSPSPVICATLANNSAAIAASVEFIVAAQKLQVVDPSKIYSFTIRLSAQSETTLESAALHVNSGGQPGVAVVDGTFNVSTQFTPVVGGDNQTQSLAYTFEAVSGLPGVSLGSGTYWLVVAASDPQTLAVDATDPYTPPVEDAIVLGSLAVDDGVSVGLVDTGMVAVVSFDGCHAIRPSPSPSITPSPSRSPSPTASVSTSPSPSPSPVICGTLGSTNLGLAAASALPFNTIAQRIRVYEASSVQSFTVNLASNQNDSALAMAEFYSDNMGLPGDALPDAAFDVANVTVPCGSPVSTTYTFLSVQPKGARLLGSVPYWLVLTAAGAATNESTLVLDVVTDAQASNPLDPVSVRVNRVARFDAAAMTWALDAGNVTAVLRLEGCHAIRPTPSPSATPSSTPSNSPSSSPTPSRAPDVTPIVANVTSSFNNSAPVVDISAPISTPAPTISPPVSPKASQQASPIPTDSGGPVITPTPSPTTSSSPSPVVQVSVTSRFTDITIGNVTVPANALGGFTLSVVNSTDTTPPATNTTTGGGAGDGGEGTAAPLTYVYTAQLDNATTFEQAYTFHKHPRETTFANLNFSITASSLKWSINLTSSSAGSLVRSSLFGSPSPSSSASPSPSAGFHDNDDDDHPTPSPTPAVGLPLVLHYNLRGLLTSGQAFNTTRGRSGVIRRNSMPQANMTTYYLPLASTSALNTVAAQVEVFDVALLDGRLALIEHDIVLLNSTDDIDAAALDNSIEYVLELRFPPFEASLYYDPSLGLGVLVGSDPSHDGGGGGGGFADNTGLVVALAVVLPLAGLVVVVVVVGGFIALRYRKRLQERFARKQPQQGAVYFDDEM